MKQHVKRIALWTALGVSAWIPSDGTAAKAKQLEELVVKPGTYREEQPVGPYQQPEWTTHRRFTTTRVYLQQMPGEVGVEQWWRGRYYDNGDSKHRFQTEAELGLPHRFQLDMYANVTLDAEGKWAYDSTAPELRWAPADWGVIPLNPTAYLEYKLVDEGADVVEAKLLLGEELWAGWHWGLNLVYERELGGEKAEELAASQAFSYSLIDRKLGVGIEMKYASETTEGTRTDPEETFLLGPSLQWRPTANSHIDVVPLAGLTEDAPDVEAYVVLGYDFGKPGQRERGPASLKSE